MGDDAHGHAHHDGAHVHRHTALAEPHAHPDDPRALLRAHGLRATAPRLRLLGVMAERDHLTAEALHREMADDGVALTTVYRTLESLEQAGLVWATQVPDVGRTYHLGTHPPHAHLYCRVCGSLWDLAGPSAEVWAEQVPERVRRRARPGHRGGPLRGVPRRTAATDVARSGPASLLQVMCKTA